MMRTWQGYLAKRRRTQRARSLSAVVLVGLFTLAQVQTAATEIVNSVVATGWRNGVPIVSAPATETVDVTNAAPALVVEKVAATQSYSVVGDVVSYIISVTNTGNVTLKDVTLSDPDAETLSCPGGGAVVARLMPGASESCTATLIADAADVSSGSIVNTVSVKANDLQGNVVGPFQDTATVIRTSADLVTVKTLASGDPTPAEGETVTFRIAVTNNGPEQATGVEVTEKLPAGLSYLSDNSGGAFAPATGIWSLGTLPFGATKLLQITATVDAGTAGRTLTNNAMVTRLDQNDGTTAGDDNSASITVPAADLLTEKSVLMSGPFSEGDTVEFQIRVTNNGPDDATNVTLTDILPAGLTPSRTGTSPSQGSYDEASGMWIIGTLPDGATATLVIAATIDIGRGGETIVNNTTAAEDAASGDPVTGNDSLSADIMVELPVLDAVDDRVGGIDGVRGATGVLDVSGNDRRDGNPVMAGDLTIINLTPGGPLTLSADGRVDVAAGTPAGTYNFTYEACMTALPTICDTAVVAVTVVAPIINAVDDEPARTADGTAGALDFLNIFDNDTLGGVALRPVQVLLTELAQEPGSYLQLDPDGTITLVAGTPAGIYTLDYEICDIINPDSCDRATARITVEAPASISGVVYEDSNGDGVYDAGSDAPRANYTVEMVLNDVVAASATTNADGIYSIPPIPAGIDYRLIFKDPDGSIVGGIPNLDLLPGQDLRDQNMPTDPMGVVYDAIVRRPVDGAVVTITDDDGIALPAACLFDPTSQGQTTGVKGGYRFDLIPGADPACPASETRYQIVVAAPSGYEEGASTLLPAMAGDAELSTCLFDAVPGGACQPSDSPDPPPIGTPAIYALSILLEAGDPRFMHNHIPIDPLPSQASVSLTKVADRSVVSRGEQVTFTIEAVNGGNIDYTGVSLVDVVPAGFRYVVDSATVDGVAVEPIESGAQLVFDNLALAANQTLVIQITLDVLGTAGAGRYTNRSHLLDQAGNSLAPEASATVEMQIEAVFDCSDIIGKVFDDRDRSGFEDSGEPGLAGVRITTMNGKIITTDRYGRFHVACADIPDEAIGSNYILELDERTLPAGYRLTTENPRVVRLTAGKTIKVNFGAASGRIVRLDINGGAFEENSTELKQRWLQGIDQLVEILHQEFSILRLSYRAAAEEGDLAQERLDTIIALIRERWVSNDERYPLKIESEIIR